MTYHNKAKACFHSNKAGLGAGRQRCCLMVNQTMTLTGSSARPITGILFLLRKRQSLIKWCTHCYKPTARRDWKCWRRTLWWDIVNKNSINFGQLFYIACLCISPDFSRGALSWGDQGPPHGPAERAVCGGLPRCVRVQGVLRLQCVWNCALCHTTVDEPGLRGC